MNESAPKRIPVAGPWITQKEVDYVADAAANAWFSRAGEWYDRFEKAFAAYTEAPEVIALSSATAGLHIGLLALDLSPGAEVITTAITDMGALTPILYQGAIPVFADVAPRTYNLTARSIEARLSPRTSAIGRIAEITANVARMVGLPTSLMA